MDLQSAWVSEVSAGTSEGVGWMVNGTSLASGSTAGQGACGGGRPVGAETHVHNEFAEVGRFSEHDRGGLVRRSRVDERQVMGVLGGGTRG